MAIAFYSIGILDLLSSVTPNSQEASDWRAWVWDMYSSQDGGFRPSAFMSPGPARAHIIMTYTALLTLAILRDPFDALDRTALLAFVRRCQREDGSFSTTADSESEDDLRTLYCAFAICHMLNDWSGVDVQRALAFIARCRVSISSLFLPLLILFPQTYQGGYGQAPHSEAHGGLTYVAIASVYLAGSTLSEEESRESVRWLLGNQCPSSGFCGRTSKPPDACYCFWCGAALKILGAAPLVDAPALQSFIQACEFRYGGIAKAPGEMPDPYHTYLALAALTMYAEGDVDLDPLLNARTETAEWARKQIPANNK